MCGRFTQTKSREEVIAALGGIELPPLFLGRYNIAPTQKIAVLRQKTALGADVCIWGFQNPRSPSPIINARSETLAERPMFKDLLQANRCLIPADGFFEWKGKQPYYFQLPEHELFAFAGLWRNNRCVIITREANASMQGIHDRMPVILARAEWVPWLENFSIQNRGPELTTRPVSRRVNSVAHDDPECIEAGPQQGELF